MRVFHVQGSGFAELSGIPAALPDAGFLWLASSRDGFSAQAADLQATLQRYGCGALVDEHVSDLLNDQLPSHFDTTSWYDLLVFRRLAAGLPSASLPGDNTDSTAETARLTLTTIDTSPVGFAAFDRVLITVHPADCGVLEFFAERLATLVTAGDGRGTARLPASPADLMLRMVNHMVDNYLALRRLLTRQLGLLQEQLLDARKRFDDWAMLLESRNALHTLEDTCEDQSSALQEWIDALDEWPAEADAQGQRERELLRVRSRDVLEHIERVLSHVRRLEQSAETAVQLHFSALGHRTNDIMRTLTVLTAVFLPLNLITGFFGMNFDHLPLIHNGTGVWIAIGAMLMVALGLAGFFWRRRYLGNSRPD